MNDTKHVRTLPFEHELFMLALTEGICEAMAEQHISRADLARRLDRSRGWVTRLLQHDANPTVKTLVEIARALDLRWTATLRTPRGGTKTNHSEDDARQQDEGAARSPADYRRRIVVPELTPEVRNGESISPRRVLPQPDLPSRATTSALRRRRGSP